MEDSKVLKSRLIGVKSSSAFEQINPAFDWNGDVSEAPFDDRKFMVKRTSLQETSTSDLVGQGRARTADSSHPRLNVSSARRRVSQGSTPSSEEVTPKRRDPPRYRKKHSVDSQVSPFLFDDGSRRSSDSSTTTPGFLLPRKEDDEGIWINGSVPEDKPYVPSVPSERKSRQRKTSGPGPAWNRSVSYEPSGPEIRRVKSWSVIGVAEAEDDRPMSRENNLSVTRAGIRQRSVSPGPHMDRERMDEERIQSADKSKKDNSTSRTNSKELGALPKSVSQPDLIYHIEEEAMNSSMNTDSQVFNRVRSKKDLELIAGANHVHEQLTDVESEKITDLEIEKLPELETKELTGFTIDRLQDLETETSTDAESKKPVIEPNVTKNKIEVKIGRKHLEFELQDMNSDNLDPDDSGMGASIPSQNEGNSIIEVIDIPAIREKAEKLRVGYRSSFEYKFGMGFGECEVAGIEYLPNGNVIVYNRPKHQLRLFDLDFKCIASCEVPPCRTMGFSTDTKVALATEKVLIFCQVGSSSIKKTSEQMAFRFRVRNSIRIGNILFVVCDANGQGVIYILTKTEAKEKMKKAKFSSWKIIHTLASHYTQNMSASVFLAADTEQERIIIADVKNRKLLAVTSDGKVPFIVALGWLPRGVAVVDEFLIVCNDTEHSLCLLSGKTGQRLKTLIRGLHFNPSYMAFDPVSRRLLVSSVKSATIRLYDVSSSDVMESVC